MNFFDFTGRADQSDPAVTPNPHGQIFHKETGIDVSSQVIETIELIQYLISLRYQYCRCNLSFCSWIDSLTYFKKSHHPSSPPSTRASNLLRSSLSTPYPATSSEGKPLEFDLQVVECSPTSDQVKTILSYLPSQATNSSMVFLSAHPSGPSTFHQPTTVQGIAELAEKHPLALKWSIDVDWNDGKVGIGDVEGVKGILENLRRKRDGEHQEEQVHQPKGWFT